MRLVVGNKNLSSWSLRPWLLLRQAGIEFVEEVRLFEQGGWRTSIKDASPSGRVPALEVDGLVLWDSLAICEYVAETRPDLWPADRAARAVARAVSAEMHSGFGGLRRDLSMDVTARVPRRTRAHDTVADIARVIEIWNECRSRFGGGGPFLFGTFSVADAMFAPVVWRFRTYDVPVSGPAAEWYGAMLELPAMKDWERDAIAEVARTKPGRSTPDPTSAEHCFAVIFSSQRTPEAAEEYASTTDRMVELARNQPGFLGIESARGADGFGITVSYWSSLESIAGWKAQLEHKKTQARARAAFYARYQVRICTVDRGYKFPA